MEKEISKLKQLTLDWLEKTNDFNVPAFKSIQSYKRLDKYILNLENNFGTSFFIILKVIKDDIGLFKTLQGWVKLYEPNVIKKLCEYLYFKNKEKYGSYKVVLDYWNEDLQKYYQTHQERVDKYQLWKKENPEEAQRIIQELEDIIDSGIIE